MQGLSRFAQLTVRSLVGRATVHWGSKSCEVSRPGRERKRYAGAVRLDEYVNHTSSPLRLAKYLRSDLPVRRIRLEAFLEGIE